MRSRALALLFCQEFLSLLLFSFSKVARRTDRFVFQLLESVSDSIQKCFGYFHDTKISDEKVSWREKKLREKEKEDNASERRLLTRRAREREREREREKKVKKRRREEKRRRCRREARTSCELPLEVHRDNSHRRSHVWRSNLLVHREEGGR